MPLSQVAALVVEATGRRDLDGDPALTDLINAGQRWLDGRYDIAHGWGEVEEDLEVTKFSLILPAVLSIKDVRAYSTGDTEGVRYLTKLSFRELVRKGNSDADTFATVEKGFPAWYSVTSTGPNATDIEDIGLKLWVLPPADKAYKVVVRGLLASDPLSDEGDISYWTEKHPEALAMSTCAIMMMLRRSREGVAEYREYVRDLLRGAELSTYDLDVLDTPNMEMRNAW